MSVAARSPHRSNKRHFEHSESPERYSQDTPFTSAHKRFRPAASRCVPLTERQPYVVTPTTVAALRGLFPDMDDKVSHMHLACTSSKCPLICSDSRHCACCLQTIGDVLEACGNNIDVAIKQLGQLRLTAHAGAAQAPAGEPVTQQPAIAGPASTSAAGELCNISVRGECCSTCMACLTAGPQLVLGLCDIMYIGPACFLQDTRHRQFNPPQPACSKQEH